MSYQSIMDAINAASKRMETITGEPRIFRPDKVLFADALAERERRKRKQQLDILANLLEKTDAEEASIYKDIREFERNMTKRAKAWQKSISRIEYIAHCAETGEDIKDEEDATESGNS